MKVSNFNLTSKGAAVSSGVNTENNSASFTYLMADTENMNFRMFSGSSEAWINHRDNGKVANVDPDIVEKLVKRYSSNDKK